MFAYLTWNPGPIRVLLVEDSMGDAAMVKDSLKESQADFEVAHVERLSQAIDHLAKTSVDVVVLDLGLPDSKGIDTLTKMRKAAPHVSIVVLTGINDEGLSMEALEHGAQDYLVKDLTEGDLLVHSICHAIERNRLHAKLSQAQQHQLENQKLESLAMLAGGMAHDFNNHLTVILGKAEMAQRKATTSPPVKEALEQIKTAGKRAGEICKQLLAYAGKGGRVLLVYDLSVVIEEMAPFLKQSLPHNVTLEYKLSKPLPRILGDLSQLRQLVMNLVHNAAEAIGNEQGTITISTSALRADRKYLDKTLLGSGLAEGDFVCLEVVDTGCGIDPAMQSRVFEPFFSTKCSGRGLGLAAVHGIIRASEGTLEVLSEKGKGATFSVLFPSSTGSAATRPAMKVPGDSWRGLGTILVVDDDKRVQALLGEMLKEMGFKVLLSNDGVEGMENYREHLKEIDLVLLDMTMPRMNGRRTYTGIRQIKPDAPIVLMSGYAKEECETLLAGEGLAGFIQKPFHFTDLRNQIHAILKK